MESGWSPNVPAKPTCKTAVTLSQKTGAMTANYILHCSDQRPPKGRNCLGFGLPRANAVTHCCSCYSWLPDAGEFRWGWRLVNEGACHTLLHYSSDLVTAAVSLLSSAKARLRGKTVWALDCRTQAPSRTTATAAANCRMQ